MLATTASTHVVTSVASSLITSAPKYLRGLLPLSADPVTYGHLDLVTRAAAQCHTLLVMVADNPSKKALFDAQTRKLHVERAITELGVTNAQVVVSDGLATDVFMTECCDVLFRGVRDEADLEYETLQLKYHSMAYPPIENKSIILSADPTLAHIQSSVVREFAQRMLPVAEMTPMFVAARLRRVLHQQKVVGVLYGKDFPVKDRCTAVQRFRKEVVENFEGRKGSPSILTTVVDTTTFEDRLMGYSRESEPYQFERLLRLTLQKLTGVAFVVSTREDFIPLVHCNVLVGPGADLAAATAYQAEYKYGTQIPFTGDYPNNDVQQQVAAKVRAGEI